MTKSELLELIANRENSGVEFKRDDVRPEQIAKEIVALANFRAGACCWASKTMRLSPVFDAKTLNGG